MDIFKQIDSSDLRGVSDDIVAFVEAVYPGDGNDQQYEAAIYARPIGIDPPSLARCGHEHRDPDLACRCARRLLRVETRRRHAKVSA